MGFWLAQSLRSVFFFNLCQAFEFFLMSLKWVKLTLFLISRKECGAGGQ